MFLSHIDRLPEHLSARSLQTILAFSVSSHLRSLLRQRAGDFWDSPEFDWTFARGHLAELCQADELSLRDTIATYKQGRETAQEFATTFDRMVRAAGMD